MAGAFSDFIPQDVRENTRRHRTFAEIIQGLGEDHEQHVADLDAFEKRLEENRRG